MRIAAILFTGRCGVYAQINAAGMGTGRRLACLSYVLPRLCAKCPAITAPNGRADAGTL